MTRGRLLIGALVGAVAMAGPAWAQNGKADAASRDPGTSVERTGSAVDRPSSGGSSEVTSSPAGSSSSSPGSVSPRTFDPSPSGASGGERYVAPVRPTERYERQQTRQRGDGGGERRPSGGASSDGARAVPRGSDSAAPSSGGRSRGTSASAGANDSSPASRAVPTYSRPRDGRPATGTAIDRRVPRPGDTGGYYGGYYSTFPSLYYSRYYLPGYAFGLGYYYDPFFYDPYLYGGGYGAGYGGGYYGGGYAGSSGRGSYGHGETGSLRLKIKPRNAQVYVDGYFAGEVDQFDGIFQRLTIDAGNHHIEIRADGHKTIEFDVLIAPGETVTYKGELQ